MFGVGRVRGFVSAIDGSVRGMILCVSLCHMLICDVLCIFAKFMAWAVKLVDTEQLIEKSLQLFCCGAEEAQA